MNWNELIQEIKSEFPTFTLVKKEESGVMKVVYYLLLMFLWNKRFMEDFTTVLGKTVYMPEKFIGTNLGVQILRHERVHMRDSDGIRFLWYGPSYIILPIGPSGRAYWELRGYKESMQDSFDQTGAITDEFIESVANNFTSSKYLWMWPFPAHIHKILLRYREEIIRSSRHA